MNNSLNISNISNPLNEEYYLSCDSNHWLFIFFSGYILPFFNKRFRDYIHHLLNKKFRKLDGLKNTLNEYGFLEIQAFKNNEEMIKFINRLSKKMGYDLDDKIIEEISWLVSGDSDNEHISIEQSFTKLKELIMKHSP